MESRELRESNQTDKSNTLKKVEDAREKLNQVSPAFCLAKWDQMSLHLHASQHQACHLSEANPIDVPSLEKNPLGLYNSSGMKKTRTLHTRGVRSKGCNYCWKAEDRDQNSERYYKSANWSMHRYDEFSRMKGNEDTLPSYLEVSFSNACNFKCSYCRFAFSSSWRKELKSMGDYPTDDHYHELPPSYQPIREKGSPLVEAFWKSFPEVYPGLRLLRVTGGEPLLHGSLYRLLDYIQEHPAPIPHLAVNTNLGVSRRILDRFIERLRRLREKEMEFLEIYTSCDNHGAQAEYLRHGLRYEYWLKNCRYILESLPDIQLNIMCTFSNLCLTSGFTRFLRDILKLKQDYASDIRPFPVYINFEILQNPSYQSIKCLPLDESITDLARGYRDFMLDHPADPGQARGGFIYQEVDLMNRIVALLENRKKPENVDAANFYAFFNEHDRRRGTNFLQAFPELSEWYAYCSDKFDLREEARGVLDDRLFI